MLGIGRASEYAGWWSSGAPSALIKGTSHMALTVNQLPQFGIESPHVSDVNLQGDGAIDLTGYTSLSGFNNSRWTTVWTVYPDWPTSGLPIGDPSAYIAINLTQQLDYLGTDYFFNMTLDLSPSGSTPTSTLYAREAGTNLALPGSYTQYMQRWLTFVASTAETSSVFTSWTGPTSGNALYKRLAVYDTQTGVLIAKLDVGIGSYTPPPISSFQTTVPTTIDTGATGSLYTNTYGSSGGAPSGTSWQSDLGGVWSSWGTMFDPSSVTDKTWLAARPNATIGTGVAWYNLQMTNYTYDSGTSSYYTLASGMDRYSQANNWAWKSWDISWLNANYPLGITP